MKQRVLSILLATMLVFTLTSCKTPGATTDSEPSNSNPVSSSTPTDGADPTDKVELIEYKVPNLPDDASPLEKFDAAVEMLGIDNLYISGLTSETKLANTRAEVTTAEEAKASAQSEAEAEKIKVPEYTGLKASNLSELVRLTVASDNIQDITHIVTDHVAPRTADTMYHSKLQGINIRFNQGDILDTDKISILADTSEWHSYPISVRFEFSDTECFQKYVPLIFADELASKLLANTENTRADESLFAGKPYRIEHYVPDNTVVMRLDVDTPLGAEIDLHRELESVHLAEQLDALGELRKYVPNTADGWSETEILTHPFNDWLEIDTASFESKIEYKSSFDTTLNRGVYIEDNSWDTYANFEAKTDIGHSAKCSNPVVTNGEVFISDKLTLRLDSIDNSPYISGVVIYGNLNDHIELDGQKGLEVAPTWESLSAIREGAKEAQEKYSSNICEKYGREITNTPTWKVAYGGQSILLNPSDLVEDELKEKFDELLKNETSMIEQQIELGYMDNISRAQITWWPSWNNRLEGCIVTFGVY